MFKGKQNEYFKKLNAAEKEYTESEIPLTIKELSRRYGIGYNNLKRYAKERKWVERRKRQVDSISPTPSLEYETAVGSAYSSDSYADIAKVRGLCRKILEGALKLPADQLPKLIPAAKLLLEAIKISHMLYEGGESPEEAMIKPSELPNLLREIEREQKKRSPKREGSTPNASESTLLDFSLLEGEEDEES